MSNDLLTMVDSAVVLAAWPAADVSLAYLGGWDATHVWTRAEVHKPPQRYRLPCWVAPPPHWADQAAGRADGQEFNRQLRRVGAPRGCLVALDMEETVAPAYVLALGRELHSAGHRVVVYGSADFVRGNPPLDGFWLAAWGSNPAQLLTIIPDVWGVQYVGGPLRTFDLSLVRQHWRLWEINPPTRRAHALGVARRLAALIAAAPPGWRAAAGRRARRIAQALTGKP